MESCRVDKMTHRSILLVIVILTTCSIGESEGFFLKNFIPETITEETEISTTTLNLDKSSADINRVPFDDIHRNSSEKLEESSTQIVNLVKDIVSQVLDEHLTDNKTKHELPDENNHIDTELRNINPDDDDNDMPTAEALVTTKQENELNAPTLSIVKIPEADNEDIATALEDNIRSSVQDEIQLEQNFESSAIDVIDDIPDPEVRQTLTEDLMAIEYPQGVKKLVDNNVEPEPIVTQAQDKIDSTEESTDARTESIKNETSPSLSTTVATDLPNTTTTISTTTSSIISVSLNSSISADNEAASSKENKNIPTEHTSEEVEKTISNQTETMPYAEVEVNTPTIQIFQEITLIPSEEIIHNLQEPEDTSSLLETESIRMRRMRGFSEESDSDKSSKSNSSISSDSSNLPSLSDEPSAFIKDDNVAAEDSSDEVDSVISQDASIEESFESPSTTTQKVITTVITKVTPTPRPSIVSTLQASTMDSNNSATAEPILLEATSESTGDVLNDIAVTFGDGKHIVIKKPGVEEEYVLNITEKSILEGTATADAVDTEAVHFNTESEMEGRADVHNMGSNLPGVTEPTNQLEEITNAIEEESLVTDNHFETEIPESNVSEKKGKSKDLDNVTPTENVQKPFIENDSPEVSVPEPEETVTDDATSDNNESFPMNDEDNREHTDELETTTPSPHALHPQSDQYVEIERTVVTDENESTQTSEIASKLLNVEATSAPTLVSPSEPALQVNEDIETSTEAPYLPLDGGEKNLHVDATSKPTFTNEISKHVWMETPELQTHDADSITHETSTEKLNARNYEEITSPALVKTLIEAAELTTEFARHVDSFRTTSDEIGAISDEIVSPAAAGRSFNAIVAEGLGKPLPTRSVGDEPSSSSYSSEDKTTTVVVLCSAAAVIFVAFSVAIYLITFQRQHGTLDIEMQEQQCGKGDLEDEEDAETRVTLLNQCPSVDSDDHSID